MTKRYKAVRKLEYISSSSSSYFIFQHNITNKNNYNRFPIGSENFGNTSMCQKAAREANAHLTGHLSYTIMLIITREKL